MVTVHDRVLNYGSEGRDREAEEDEGLHGNKVLRFWLFQRHVNDSARDTQHTHFRLGFGKEHHLHKRNSYPSRGLSWVPSRIHNVKLSLIYHSV